MSYRVLFVCMGNICRSPAAEGVFRSKRDAAGLSEVIEIDSAGTIGYHEGNLPDSRMRAAAQKRGYVLESRARKVRPKDLDYFDLILAMDRDNLFHLHALDKDGIREHKIKLMAEYHPNPDIQEVPDPYYGGPEGFETVLDIVEAASDRLLEELRQQLRR